MKKHGFTLAEVLITLGIIGVVAAMVLPAVMSNVQKHIFYNQYRKSVSTLNRGFTLMLGKEGVTSLSDTEVFSSINGSCKSDNAADSSNCKEFYNKLKEYFKITSFGSNPAGYKWRYFGTSYKNNWRTDRLGNVIYFADGMMLLDVSFFAQAVNSNNNPNGSVKAIAVFTVDINGKKGPNTYGRDLFQMFLDNNGIIYQRGSKKYSLFELENETGMYWRTTSSESATCKNDNISWGSACGARLDEEGKMNY